MNYSSLNCTEKCSLWVVFGPDVASRSLPHLLVELVRIWYVLCTYRLSFEVLACLLCFCLKPKLFPLGNMCWHILSQRKVTMLTLIAIIQLLWLLLFPDYESLLNSHFLSILNLTFFSMIIILAFTRWDPLVISFLLLLMSGHPPGETWEPYVVAHNILKAFDVV